MQKLGTDLYTENSRLIGQSAKITDILIDLHREVDVIKALEG
jgi:hypothetical protein